jgi:hypothetical protein
MRDRRIAAILVLGAALIICVASSAFAADKASVTCKAKDGTDHTYTVTGANCSGGYNATNQQKFAHCDDSAGNLESTAYCYDGGEGSCSGNCNIKKVLGGTGTKGTIPPSSGKLPTAGAAATTLKSGSRTGATSTSTSTSHLNPALTGSANILGASGGAGSAATAGSKAKLPTGGANTLGR